MACELKIVENCGILHISKYERAVCKKATISTTIQRRGDFMCTDFETMAKQSKAEILQITNEKSQIIARGIWMQDAMAVLQDNSICWSSYPDTGVFVLFQGSQAALPEAGKYAACISTDQKTTREIVFQSRNAAAQFVLGNIGRTNHWEPAD